MELIEVTPLSLLSHNAQIVTGFRMLQKQGWNIKIKTNTDSALACPPHAALVRVIYMGKTIFYDLWDGYHVPSQDHRLSRWLAQAL